MDLSNTRRRHGNILKLGKHISPLGPEFPGHDLLHLAMGHVIRGILHSK